MKRVDGLPHRIVGVQARPHWNFRQQKKEIHNEEDDGGTGDMSKQ